MHTIARIVKVLFYIPILILVSPALLLLTAAVFLVESEEGPLRVFFLQDVQRHGFRKGFSLFMRENFIKTYKYNIQGFVVGAAGFLVVSVGLRSLSLLPVEAVYLALGIEFILLLIYGVATFYTIDAMNDTNGHAAKGPDVRESLTTALDGLNKRLEQLGGQMQRMETRFNPAEAKELNEKFTGTIKDMSNQMALLESRLRVTEQKFEQLAKLNTSMDNLSHHLDLIVNDHLNSRVRREFETLIAQMSQRVSTPAR